MKIAQASAVLNSTFNGFVGESDVVAEDMSNLVDVGHVITSSTDFGNNLNVYTKTLWDKVGETIYNNAEYQGSAPNIYATDAEYGSALEKIRIIASDYEDNDAWNTTVSSGSSHDEMFGYHPAEVTAKYFNSVVTYRSEPVTITEKQLRSAFTSVEEMMRFIGMLEQTYISKIRMAFDILIRMTINTYAAYKINAANGVVNLLTEYNTATGNTLTAAKAMSDTNFLRFAAARIKMYRDFITEPTSLYNTDGYVNFTKRDEVKTILLTDFIRAIETNVLSTAYNADYVKLSDYDIVSKWQGSGKTNDYASRSSINITIPSGSTSVTVSQANIVGMIFDKKACMINAYKTETGVAHNDFDKWNNYVWLQEAGYFIDTGESGVIFIIEDVATGS